MKYLNIMTTNRNTARSWEGSSDLEDGGMANAIIGLCVTAVLFLLIGGTLYGCSNANNKYYQAQSECVQHGGTWIPTGTPSSYEAACVNK